MVRCVRRPVQREAGSLRLLVLGGQPPNQCTKRLSEPYAVPGSFNVDPKTSRVTNWSKPVGAVYHFHAGFCKSPSLTLTVAYAAAAIARTLISSDEKSLDEI